MRAATIAASCQTNTNTLFKDLDLQSHILFFLITIKLAGVVYPETYCTLSLERSLASGRFHSMLRVPVYMLRKVNHANHVHVMTRQGGFKKHAKHMFECDLVATFSHPFI